jgi:ATP-binding cassette subfamily B protein
MFATYKTYYHFVLRYKWAFILFMAISTVRLVLDSVQPYFFKLFVDTSPLANYSQALLVLLGYFLVRLGIVIFSNLREFTGDKVVISAARDLRLAVFRHLHNLDFAFHTTKSTGSLISAFKRGDSAFFDIFDTLNYKMYEVFISFCVAFYFLSTVDLKLSLILTLSFFLNLGLTSFLIKRNLSARVAFNDSEDDVSGLITDNVINFDTVKLFAKENWEYTRLSGQFKDWYQKFWRYVNTFRLIDITVGVVGNLTLFAILILTLNASAANSISLGSYIMTIGFIVAFYPKIFEMVWQLRRLAKHHVDIQKYIHLLSQPITVLDPVNPHPATHTTGHITFSQVSFNYPGTPITSVSDINLDIAPGQSVAFVGHSGAGKTTLIKLLMRFYDVTSGTISLDGININRFSKSQLRSFMGVVPQDPILFNASLRFNITYGASDPSSLTHADLLRAVQLAQLTDFVNSLPKGFDTQVGERGIKLSGGQKQRLAIARMIISNPDIVIFDEATSQLDSQSEHLIHKAFWEASRGKTTLIIAHRLSTVMKADKIVVLNQGKIVEVGTHAQLVQNPTSLYTHFWSLQTSLHSDSNHIN